MCKDVLTRTIDKIEVVQIEKIKQRYDVIGIFNYIDHSQNPLELIEKAKKVTDRILLVTHSPNKSGPQHRYILDKDTITCLFQDYGSVRFLQLEKEFKDYIIAIAEKNFINDSSSSIEKEAKVINTKNSRGKVINTFSKCRADSRWIHQYA